MISTWAAKCFAQELSYWQSYRDRSYLASFFYHLSCIALAEVPLFVLEKLGSTDELNIGLKIFYSKISIFYILLKYLLNMIREINI